MPASRQARPFMWGVTPCQPHKEIGHELLHPLNPASPLGASVLGTSGNCYAVTFLAAAGAKLAGVPSWFSCLTDRIGQWFRIVTA